MYKDDIRVSTYEGEMLVLRAKLPDKAWYSLPTTNVMLDTASAQSQFFC